MAPWQVQSGKGTAVTNGGAVTAQRRTALPAGYENDCAGAPAQGAVYGVCLSDGPCTKDSASATPADTVKLALRGGLRAKASWTEAPDLVLTGINSGPNISASVNDSGTVGAAVAAIDQEVPALAFSSSGDATNTSFPRVNYRAHAEFGARLVAGLKQRGLLTSKFALKVDYPDVSSRRRRPRPRSGRASATGRSSSTRSSSAGTATPSTSRSASARSTAAARASAPRAGRTPTPPGSSTRATSRSPRSPGTARTAPRSTPAAS